MLILSRLTMKRSSIGWAKFSYFITLLLGSTTSEKEGQEQWQWHSGEPVTYTNWNANEPGDSDKGDEDYVILFGGQWMDIGPGDIHWRLTRTAILERKKPPVGK